MGILLFLLVNIVLFICIITAVSSVKICSNETQSGKQVILRKPRDTSSVESCGCSVKLVDGDRSSTVKFQQNQVPGGCQYKLMFNLKTETREYNCRIYPNLITFTLTPTDQLYINLVNDEKNNTGGFTFNFNITVPSGQKINLTCRSPSKNPLVTTQTSSPGRGSPLHPHSTTPTTVRGSGLHFDSTTSATGQIESTEITDRSKITEEPQNSNLPVIVGCTVSGVVLVSVIVIIVICFLKRRKQKHQTDQNVSDQNLTCRNVDPENYDNITYTSSPTEHQNTVDIKGHSDNYDHIPNNSSQNTVDIEGHSDNYDHIPNNSNQNTVDIKEQSDNYDHIPNNSSQDAVDINRHSDCYDHIPNNSSRPEHQNRADLSRHSDCYDHIPNNSIQTSSDKSKPGELAPEPCEQPESVPDQFQRVPNTSTEYGVVKKKTKKSASQDKGMKLNNNPNKTIKHDDYENVPKDNLNLKMEINRIVGPKGDNYTQVNKC